MHPSTSLVFRGNANRLAFAMGVDLSLQRKMRKDEQEVVRGEVLENRRFLSVDAENVFDTFDLP